MMSSCAVCRREAVRVTFHEPSERALWVNVGPETTIRDLSRLILGAFDEMAEVSVSCGDKIVW
jgi:hypothetical protein